MFGDFYSIFIIEMKLVVELELKFRVFEDFGFIFIYLVIKGVNWVIGVNFGGGGFKIIFFDYVIFYFVILWVIEFVFIILCLIMSFCVGDVRKVKFGVWFWLLCGKRM